MTKAKLLAIGCYAGIALITFGHSAANDEYEEAVCAAQEAKADHSVYCGPPNAAINGFIAATVWPLYWSWEMWSRA